MKNNLALHTFISGFIIAVFLNSFFPLGISFSILLIFLSGAIFLFQKYAATDAKEKQKIFFIALFLFSFGLGIFRYEIKDTQPLDAHLQEEIGKPISVSAVISDEPERKENTDELTVDFQNLSIGTSTIPVSGRAIISTDLYPIFQYGDLIQISGTLQTPRNFYTATSGKEFDYVSYLAKDDIFYTMNAAHANLVASGQGNPLKKVLFEIKDFFIARMNQNIPEPEASLMSGILLGAKTSLDTNITNIFQIAGLSHIVALSGYNITVVASAVMSLLSFLPRIVASSFGIISIILFVIMSGGTSTAVRAGIMSVIALIAQITGRKYDIGRALLVTGFLMVLINPKILVFDISFQLSYLATIAIIYLSPILKEKFHGITDSFGLRDIVATTLAAQILVLPLIVYQMGILSLVALPANMFVLVFVPTTMLLGFITGFFGCIWPPLSVPFAWISYLFLAYIIDVATFFASLPASYLLISWFSGWMMMLCYAVIFIWIIREHKKAP